MKKLATAVAFALALSAAGMAFAAGGGPKATGGAGFSQDDNQYHIGFNAREQKKQHKKQKPDRGHVNLVDLAPTIGDVPDSSFTGHVTCYEQEGKKAWFSGTIDNPIPFGDPQTTTDDLDNFLIAVQDNGKKKETPRDQITVRWGDTELACESRPPAENEITNGNVQVHEPKKSSNSKKPKKSK